MTNEQEMVLRGRTVTEYSEKNSRRAAVLSEIQRYSETLSVVSKQLNDQPGKVPPPLPTYEQVLELTVEFKVLDARVSELQNQLKQFGLFQDVIDPLTGRFPRN